VFFYFFIEVIQQHKKRIALYTFINNNAFNIHVRAESLLTEICKSVNNSHEDFVVSMAEFYNSCNTIFIHSSFVEVWFYPSRLSFMEFVLTICDDIEMSTAGLLNYIELLDEDWIRHLSNIQNDVQNIKKFLKLNREHSKLNLVSSWIWHLYYESQKLKVLENKYFFDYYKIKQNQDPISMRDTSKILFTVKVK